MWASWYFRRGYPEGLQVGRGSERHVSLESALIWGPPAHLTFSSGGRGYCLWFTSRTGGAAVHVSSREMRAAEGQEASVPLSHSSFRKFLWPEPPTSAQPPRGVRSGGKPRLERPPRREGGGKTWRRIRRVRQCPARRSGSRGHGSQVEMPAPSWASPRMGGRAVSVPLPRRRWPGDGGDGFSAPPPRTPMAVRSGPPSPTASPRGRQSR